MCSQCGQLDTRGVLQQPWVKDSHEQRELASVSASATRGRGRGRSVAQMSSSALRSRGAGGRMLRAGMHVRTTGFLGRSTPMSSHTPPAFPLPLMSNLQIREPPDMHQDHEMDAAYSSGDGMDLDVAMSDQEGASGVYDIGEPH